MNIMKATFTGVFSHHRQPAPVTGYTLEGPGDSWSTSGWPAPTPLPDQIRPQIMHRPKSQSRLGFGQIIKRRVRIGFV